MVDQYWPAVMVVLAHKAAEMLGIGAGELSAAALAVAGRTADIAGYMAVAGHLDWRMDSFSLFPSWQRDCVCGNAHAYLLRSI